MKIRYTYLLLPLLILVSCATNNFQRQKFTDLKPINSTQEHLSQNQNLIADSGEEFIYEKDEINDSQTDEYVFFKEQSEVENEQPLDEDCGDRITFKSGAYVEVKVIQVNKNDVVYRRCDDLKGPAYTVIKDDIAELKYAHGGTENLSVRESKHEEKVEEKETENQNENFGDVADKDKPIEPFALVAFIFSLTYILWVPAIIFGIVSLIIQKKNPDQYRKNSRFFALFGTLFPLIAFVVGIIILLFLIFFW